MQAKDHYAPPGSLARWPPKKPAASSSRGETALGFIGPYVFGMRGNAYGAPWVELSRKAPRHPPPFRTALKDNRRSRTGCANLAPEVEEQTLSAINKQTKHEGIQMKKQTHRIMNTFFATILAASVAGPALAESKNKLDARVRDLTDYFEKLQKNADTAAPAEILSKADGLIIMRTYKAGFIFGVAKGHGIAIVKNKTTGKWGPVGFLKSGEGSFGFQAGGQRSDMILVLMNSAGVKLLIDPSLKLGVDVRATVGPKSAGGEANLKTDETPVLVYSDTSGAYGGASLQTGGLFPDSGENKKYYGKDLTMTEILVDGKAEPTEAAKLLADKIEEYAKPAKK
jgi:SH3 domain-containing YSC84-like protein 1